MYLTKLVVKHTSGAVKKVRLKFDTKRSIESLRESVKFPAGWGITSIAYLYVEKGGKRDNGNHI